MGSDPLTSEEKRKTRNATNARRHRARHPEYTLFMNARGRARERGLAFDLTYDDCRVPAVCPVLGIPLFTVQGNKGGGENSPTLDRINPAFGYVRGNVAVISKRANNLKSNATPEELAKLAEYAASTAAS